VRLHFESVICIFKASLLLEVMHPETQQHLRMNLACWICF